MSKSSQASSQASSQGQPKPPPPGIYADQDKKHKETQNGDQFCQNVKAEFNGSVAPNTDLNANCTLNLTDFSMKASVAPKFSHKPSGTTVKATFDSSSNFKVDVSNDRIAKGARVNLVVEKGNVVKGKLTAEYKADRIGAAATVSADGPQGPVGLDTSLVVAAHPKVVLGTAMTVGNVGAENELKSAKGALWYKENNSIFGVTVESTSGSMGNRGLNANATLYHKLSLNTEIAGSAFYDLKGEKTPILGGGAVHKLSNDVTVRGRFDTNGAASGALTHQLNSNAEVTVAGHTNIMRGLSSGKDNKVGVHYSFKK